MDTQQRALYGLVDNQALIVREGHICDIVQETQLPVSGDNIHDMPGRLATCPVYKSDAADELDGENRDGSRYLNKK